jgi:hypothetical protein
MDKDKTPVANGGHGWARVREREGGLFKLQDQILPVHGLAALADCHENPDGGTCQLGRAVTAILPNSVYLLIKPIHKDKVRAQKTLWISNFGFRIENNKIQIKN